jgi:hypothetical protein
MAAKGIKIAARVIRPAVEQLGSGSRVATAPNAYANVAAKTMSSVSLGLPVDPNPEGPNVKALSITIARPSEQAPERDRKQPPKPTIGDMPASIKRPIFTTVSPVDDPGKSLAHEPLHDEIIRLNSDIAFEVKPTLTCPNTPVLPGLVSRMNGIMFPKALTTGLAV